MNLKMMISKIEIYFFQGASMFSFGMFVFFGEKNMLMCLLCEKNVVHREKIRSKPSRPHHLRLPEGFVESFWPSELELEPYKLAMLLGALSLCSLVLKPLHYKGILN